MKQMNMKRVMALFSPRAALRALMICLIVLVAHSAAAGADLPEFGVAPLSGPDGMLLVIGGPLLHPTNAAANDGWIGYHLYRKAPGDTGFTRITSVPLSRPGSLVELEKAMGGTIDGFERFAGLRSKQELWQAIERGDSAIIAISFLSKNFRRALGLMVTDTKVEKGKSYAYRATLVAANGTESKPSDPQSAAFGTPLIPLVGPSNVKGEATNKGVVLTWQVNPADSGAFSYSVYRCPDSVGTFLRLNLAALTPAVDSGVEPGPGSFIDTTARSGRRYYYAVVSTDYAGNESPRRPLLAISPRDVAPVYIPQNVFARPSELGITVTWDAVAGGDVLGYNIYRSSNADSNFVRLNSLPLPADTGFCEDRTTTLVDRYFYRVTSVNRSGAESEKSALALSLFENRTQLLPPQAVRAQQRPNGIAVTWQAGDEPDLRGYYVFRADSYNGSLSQVSKLIAKDTTEFIDTARYLSSVGQYWYLVQSINYAGVSSNYSAPVVAYPGKPQSVDAPRSLFGYLDGRKVRLFWTGLDDNAVTGYRLYRTREADSAKWARLTVNPMPRTSSEYTDTSASEGEAYLYQLRAINAQGQEGSPSHNIRILAFAPASLPPMGLRVAQEGPALTIVWGVTNQSAIAGYRIYRRSDSEPAALLSAQMIPVTTTTHHDTSVHSGTRYYYSVSCVDQSGREGNRSTEVSFLVSK
jgi:fibronectin type 3 domain-containing protein